MVAPVVHCFCIHGKNDELTRIADDEDSDYSRYWPMPSMVEKRIPWDLSQFMYMSHGTGGPKNGRKWLWASTGLGDNKYRCWENIWKHKKISVAASTWGSRPCRGAPSRESCPRGPPWSGSAAACPLPLSENWTFVWMHYFKHHSVTFL